MATYSIMIFAWYFSASDTTCLADFSEFLDKSVGQRIVSNHGEPPDLLHRPFSAASRSVINSGLLLAGNFLGANRRAGNPVVHLRIRRNL